jgi:Zinc carboxypeptidase
MQRRALGVALATLFALAFAGPAWAAGSGLKSYKVKSTFANKQALAAAGFDMTEADRGAHLEVVATRRQVGALAKQGVKAKQFGRTRSLAQAPGDYTGSDAGFNVWTRYDAVPGDNKEQYVEQYQRIGAEPIAKLVALAPQTHLGRTIYALKITKDAKTTADGSRPAVLFNAQQHAREWLAGETCRRTLDFIVDNYGRTGTALERTALRCPGFRPTRSPSS